MTALRSRPVVVVKETSDDIQNMSDEEIDSLLEKTKLLAIEKERRINEKKTAAAIQRQKALAPVFLVDDTAFLALLDFMNLRHYNGCSDDSRWDPHDCSRCKMFSIRDSLQDDQESLCTRLQELDMHVFVGGTG